MIFPTTYTCSNTLSYLYDVHSWAEYAFYFVTMFWRRIRCSTNSLCINKGLHILDTALAMKLDSRVNITPGDQGIQPLPHSSSIGHCFKFEFRNKMIINLIDEFIPHDDCQVHYPTIVRHWISRAVQLHGMHNNQNLTPPVDFYMKSLVYTEGIGRVS
ncbi:hypothetical protein SFRURICE_012668 [Spodoptera frugiperda]|nr:hypothetical protein SFRURICE_012668 [Spodoptera frugiperda]